MRIFVMVGCMLLATKADGAQNTLLGPPTVLAGRCLAPSNVAAGSAQANLDEHATPFPCDIAVLTAMLGDRVLIQFAAKSDKSTNLLGFAGTFADPNVIEVDHFYLNDGRTLQTTKGRCQIFRDDAAAYKDIVCGARVERDDIAIASVIAFRITPKARHKR